MKIYEQKKDKEFVTPVTITYPSDTHIIKKRPLMMKQRLLILKFDLLLLRLKIKHLLKNIRYKSPGLKIKY